jgi:hypothetical protein
VPFQPAERCRKINAGRLFLEKGQFGGVIEGDGFTRGECCVETAITGAEELAALIVGYVQIPVEEYVDPLTRVPLFVLWIESPFLLLAFNVYLVNRFLMPAGNGRIFFRGTLLFLGSGLLIYGRALSLPAGQVMDRNLIFLSGPFYHFAVAAAVMVGFMSRGLRLALGEKGR